MFAVCIEPVDENHCRDIHRRYSSLTAFAARLNNPLRQRLASVYNSLRFVNSLGPYADDPP